MNLDDSMVAQLLKTYGAPPSANNMNAARQFFASNPEIAEKRAMGMRGSGIDDNSDVFGAQLEKFMAAADNKPTITKEELPPVEAPQTTNVARRAAPTNKTAPPDKKGTQYDGVPTGGQAGTGGDFTDWLLALLGARAKGGTTRVDGGPRASGTPEATFVGPMRNVDPNSDPRLQGYPRSGQGALPAPQEKLTGPQASAAAPNAQGARPQGVLEDNISDLSRIKTNEPPPTKVEGDPALTEQARQRQLQAEIEAENAHQQRLQDQIQERLRAQKEAAATLKAGSRVVRGR